MPASLYVFSTRNAKQVENPMSDYYPVAVTHVGMTVTDIYAATKWYTEILGCRQVG